MATRTVKARVELDGEKEYKAALTELNNGNRVLASEMRKLQEEYKGNAESTEYLTKRGEILERQLLQQKDKVESLREAMQNAAEKYGEADARTQKWAVQLNNAEAAQLSLERAIEENNEALQGEDQTMQGLGDTVQQLAGKLGIQLPEGATKALNGMNGLSSGTVAAMGAAVAAVAALFEAVKKLHQMTLEAAHDVDDLITKSMTSGVSQQTLQQWKYAENLIDVSVDTMTGSLTRLTRSMADANSGNEALADSFNALGISITDGNGNLRNAEDVFYDMIDALGSMENQTERDAAAMELLGRSAQELNPLIIQGSAALRELGEEAEATGYVLDESQIKKLGEVDDAYQRMQLTIDASKKQLALEFAPVSIAAMEAFSKVVNGAANAVSGLVRMGSALKNSALVSELKATADALARVLGLYRDVADELGVYSGGWYQGSDGLFHANSVGANVKGVTFDSSLGKYVTAGGTVLDADTIKYIDPETGRVRDSYAYNAQHDRWYDSISGDWIGELTVKELERLYGTDWRGPSSRSLVGRNATGTDNWRGGLTWVGESGPELAMLPRGTQILSAQESRAAGGVVIESLVINADVRQLSDLKAFLDQFSTAVVRMR